MLGADSCSGGKLCDKTPSSQRIDILKWKFIGSYKHSTDITNPQKDLNPSRLTYKRPMVAIFGSQGSNLYKRSTAKKEKKKNAEEERLYIASQGTPPILESYIATLRWIRVWDSGTREPLQDVPKCVLGTE